MEFGARVQRGHSKLRFQRIVIDFVIGIKLVSRKLPTSILRTYSRMLLAQWCVTCLGLVESPLLIVPSLPELVGYNPNQIASDGIRTFQ